MFNNLINNSNKKSKVNLTLETVLVSLSMEEEGIDRQTIADCVGLTKHQLNFRIFEKQTKFTKKDKNGVVIGEEVKCRSILKYMYEDHTDPNTEMVSGEEFARRLFESFGYEYEGEEQVERIIEEWKSKNI